VVRAQPVVAPLGAGHFATLVSGRLGEDAATGIALTEPGEEPGEVAGVAGPALGAALAVPLGLGESLGLAEPPAATTTLVMLEEQMTNAPPPFAELLHWLIVTLEVADAVPAAVQVNATSVPPLAESLHCVIVAPLVVAGNGSQPKVMPPPEPTHWLTVALVEPGLRPMKLFVTWTLQRSVPPPPLIAPLHCVTAVTGSPRTFDWIEHDASGSPAAP
jgi:hypothetical protein